MRYTPLRRVALVAAGALLGLTGLMSVASPASATDNTEPLPGCVSSTDAKLEVSGWEGGKTNAVVTYKDAAPLCDDLVVNMLSYTATSAKFALPQYLFGSQTQQINKDATSGTLTFSGVPVPDCYAQVDLVRGKRIINPLVSNDDLYGTRKLAHWNGGQGVCSAKPVAEPVSDCDGNVKISLVNPKTTDATKFEITADGGYSETVTVEPNSLGSVTVPATNATNISVKAAGKELYAGSWAKPEGCVTPERFRLCSPRPAPATS